MSSAALRPVMIHHRPESFSERWIEACRERDIPFEIVDGCRSDIVAVLGRARAFLWHFGMQEPDMLVARQVLRAAEQTGLPVFPDDRTAWHFDDKIAQKYLLEAIGAPVVPTWVFHRRDEALAWCASASFPKVFKLRRGSGSRNVLLVADRDQAMSLVRQAFGGGFRASGVRVRDEAWKVGRAARSGDLVPFLRGLPEKAIRRLRYDAVLGRERGSILFQEFLPGNAFDTRITVIGDRAFGFTRDVRPDDFRASGSGRIVYDVERVRRRCVEIAFDLTARIGAQCLALDFIADPAGEPRLLEVSYGFSPDAVHGCPGHWKRDLHWVAGSLRPEDAILDDLLHRAGAPAGR